jgi:hypothetical protein
MEKDIEQLMNLGDITKEESIELLEKHKTVFEALCSVMDVTCKHVPKKRRLNETQEFFTNVRSTLSILESGIQKGFNSDESLSLEQDEKQNLLEETVQQNNYDPGCQILSLQSEVQIRETACQKLFECFSDLQLNDQK